MTSILCLAHPSRRKLKPIYDLGYSRDTIIDLFRFIDWLMRLPDDLEQQVWQALQQYEAEHHMTYITGVERIGMRKGRLEGLLDGIALALEIKFGPAADALMPEIRVINDLTTIQAIYDRIKVATTTDEVRAVYARPTE
jgi:hypothetical protein